MNRISSGLLVFFPRLIPVVAVLLLLASCKKPDQDIVLRQIRDVVVDASSEPMLKANAIFYNPNAVRGRLKKIDIEIFVNGKKAASVDQSLKTSIPAASEFTVPLEVKLAMKEFGVMDTIFGMIGGKTFNIHYKGSLKLSYHGVPINVPVDYKDDVKLRF
ncbi:MAG TPA: LEA type 2 family protein [Chryseosolibacter sp.]|nr:LEA type 2 family protein [Chryseosolibacter sp.]